MAGTVLKSREQIAAQVERRFRADVAAAAVRETRGTRPGAAGGTGSAGPWPLSVALGHPSKNELVEAIARVSRYGEELAAWADGLGAQVLWEERRAGGLQRVPTHVVVPSIDVAARVAGRAATLQLARMRERANVLASRFPAAADQTLAHTLRQTNAWDQLDFDLLVEASTWFAEHDATGMTPRQVPLPGFHAKWLDAAGRRKLICGLSGKDDLGLVGRPALVEFAYLDPDWLAAGGRRYDSHVVGDCNAPAYPPRFVVIVENKDTFLAFPQMSGGICAFGAGEAGQATLRGLSWLAQAPRLFYWGDMDAAGLEILNAYREQGLDVESILMDLDAYGEFRRFGTNLSAGKRELAAWRARPVPTLTPDEYDLYQLLVSPIFDGPRRVEQERIPLERARRELLVMLGDA